VATDAAPTVAIKVGLDRPRRNAYPVRFGGKSRP